MNIKDVSKGVSFAHFGYRVPFDFCDGGWTSILADANAESLFNPFFVMCIVASLRKR